MGMADVATGPTTNSPVLKNYHRTSDVYNELISYGINVDIFDTVANKDEVKKELSIDLIEDYNKKEYQAIILAVAHDAFRSIDFTQLHNESTVVFDVISFIDTRNIHIFYFFNIYFFSSIRR